MFDISCADDSHEISCLSCFLKEAIKFENVVCCNLRLSYLRLKCCQLQSPIQAFKRPYFYLKIPYYPYSLALKYNLNDQIMEMWLHLLGFEELSYFC